MPREDDQAADCPAGGKSLEFRALFLAPKGSDDAVPTARRLNSHSTPNPLEIPAMRIVFILNFA